MCDLASFTCVRRLAHDTVWINSSYFVIALNSAQRRNEAGSYFAGHYPKSNANFFKHVYIVH